MKRNIIKTNSSRGFQSKNIVQSNSITRSAQGLTLVEKRILMCALAQKGGITKPLKLHAQDYADTFELDIAVAYTELKNSSLLFLKKQFTIYEFDKKGRDTRTSYNWLSHVKYVKDQAYVEVVFNPNIYHFLYDLTEQFTKYQLKQASALRSIYSWRLLELFEQMRTSKPIQIDKKGNVEKSAKIKDGWLTISIEEFWHAMEATKTHKRSFGELSRKVIKPAIKELSEKDGWLIEWRPIKKGRRVGILEFEFKKDLQGKLF